MPWVPDFVNAVELARRQTRAAGHADPVTQYVAALQAGDARSLEVVWPGTVVVHDPHAGRVSGHRQLKTFVKQSKAALARYQARFETIASTAVDGRAVVELVVRVTQGPDVVDWPMAVVAESPDDHSVVFRSYFSPLLADDRGQVRAPILEPRETDLPAVVSGFLDALAAGHAEAAAASFSPSGYLRESWPPPAVYQGTAALRSYFTEQFGAGGGIGVQPCCTTDDGVRCVVEFNCTSWGEHELPPQAGICVHERHLEGLLTAVRMYHGITVTEPGARRESRLLTPE